MAHLKGKCICRTEALRPDLTLTSLRKSKPVKLSCWEKSSALSGHASVSTSRVPADSPATWTRAASSSKTAPSCTARSRLLAQSRVQAQPLKLSFLRQRRPNKQVLQPLRNRRPLSRTHRSKMFCLRKRKPPSLLPLAKLPRAPKAPAQPEIPDISHDWLSPLRFLPVYDACRTQPASQELASLMSSCARLSAFLDSTLALASGFRACIALFRDSAFGGAAQDFASLLGRTAVMFHFRQLNLIFRLWLA